MRWEQSVLQIHGLKKNKNGAPVDSITHFRLDAVNILVNESAESEPSGPTAVTLAVMDTVLHTLHLRSILTPTTAGDLKPNHENKCTLSLLWRYAAIFKNSGTFLSMN